MKILGIETSCDETALALFENKKLLYSKVSSHLIHKNYGGVVPELASREHDKILPQLFKDCFRTVAISSNELDLIAVTQGPGLAGSLISGASFAKRGEFSLNSNNRNKKFRGLFFQKILSIQKIFSLCMFFFRRAIQKYGCGYKFKLFGGDRTMQQERVLIKGRIFG
ncbi:hypothetical protein CM15mP37_07380 [bacterium]|nr:MAG: hypothetical protein CM15mP37_07380 [bacterium]